MKWLRGGLVLGVGILLSAGSALAQFGAGLPAATPPVGRAGAPSGVAEKDDLQGFHRAIALQATSEQISEFREVIKKTDAAGRALDELGKGSDAARLAAVRLAIDAAQAETGKFVGGFSEAQKNGLRDLSSKLAKAQSELDEQQKALEAGGAAEGLRKGLANFRAQQENLAVEMSIVISQRTDDVAFTIPARRSSVTIGGQTVGVTTSALITRAREAGSEGVYSVEASTDLAEVQENLGTIMAALMNKDDRCGERIVIQEAGIDPDVPAGRAMARLHYERWVCGAAFGRREMTEGNATVVMKLAVGIGENGQVKISAENSQVEAEKFLAEMIKSGELGDALRNKIAGAVTAAVTTLKAELPPAGEATAGSARFVSPRAGALGVVVDGEMRLSDEQAKAFAEQLKERAGAQARKQ
ncbi:MAG TPA: hypothetical protein VMI10_11345 [Terriglobales bacterium]|nr:hypothetical protein [Terriglobales bacterium]